MPFPLPVDRQASTAGAVCHVRNHTSSILSSTRASTTVQSNGSVRSSRSSDRSGIAGDPALHLLEHRVGCVTSPLVLLRRHVGHACMPGLPRGDDGRAAGAVVVGCLRCFSCCGDATLLRSTDGAAFASAGCPILGGHDPFRRWRCRSNDGCGRRPRSCVSARSIRSPQPLRG